MLRITEMLGFHGVHDTSLTFQTRLFRLICLTVGFICIVVILPVNALQNLPVFINILATLLGVFAFFCYWKSVRGRDPIASLLIALLLSLDFIWFLNAGSNGSVTYYFFAVILYPMVMWRGKVRWIITGCVVLNVFALLILENLQPSLVTPFSQPSDRLIDHLAGVICSCLSVIMVLWVILSHHDWEQDQLTRYAKDLATSEKNYREVVENAKCIILRLDAHAHVTFINKFAENLFNFTRDEIVGKHVVGTILPLKSQNGQDLVAMMEEILKNPEAYSQNENENVCRDGKRVWINWSNQPIYDDQHNLVEILCVGADVTERKRAEEKRQQMEQQMLHIQKLESLGIMAGGIAHDFNNLLTAILGNVDLVRMGLKKDSEDHELLQEAAKASIQAKDLTAQLLTFAKGGKPVKTVTSLEQIVRHCVGFALRGTSVKCAVNIPSDLWPVEADTVQLTQVFNNLVINAHQAMPNGGLLTIEASNRDISAADGLLLTDGRYVQVIVRDLGHGIPEEHLLRIFDPYFTTKKTGSGLGLAVVHSIVKNHAGDITVQSRLGEGTSFTILLPAADPILNPHSSTPAAHNGIRRVLIMDDEEMVRKALVRMLKRMDCEAECANDGVEALNKCRQAISQSKPFNLVIMDLTIPGGMGGQEAIKHLREIDRHVKAVVSSGYSDSPVMADFEKYGFNAVMLKPYTMEDLESILRDIL